MKQTLLCLFVLFCAVSYAACTSTKNSHLNELKKKNILYIFGETIDSLRYDYCLLPWREKLSALRLQYEKEQDETYCYEDHRLPSWSMMKMIAGETRICTANGSSIGYIFSDESYNRDIVSWQNYYQEAEDDVDIIEVGFRSFFDDDTLSVAIEETVLFENRIICGYRACDNASVYIDLISIDDSDKYRVRAIGWWPVPDTIFLPNMDRNKMQWHIKMNGKKETYNLDTSQGSRVRIDKNSATNGLEIVYLEERDKCDNYAPD